MIFSPLEKKSNSIIKYKNQNAKHFDFKYQIKFRRNLIYLDLIIWINCLRNLFYLD